MMHDNSRQNCNQWVTCQSTRLHVSSSWSVCKKSLWTWRKATMDLFFPTMYWPTQLNANVKTEFIICICCQVIYKVNNASKQILTLVMLNVYLKLLRETLQVVLVELHDVFNKVLDGDGLHIICRRNTEQLAKCPLFCVCVVHNALLGFVSHHHVFWEFVHMWVCCQCTQGNKCNAVLANKPLSQMSTFGILSVYTWGSICLIWAKSAPNHTRGILDKGWSPSHWDNSAGDPAAIAADSGQCLN